MFFSANNKNQPAVVGHCNKNSKDFTKLLKKHTKIVHTYNTNLASSLMMLSLSDKSLYRPSNSNSLRKAEEVQQSTTAQIIFKRMKIDEVYKAHTKREITTSHQTPKHTSHKVSITFPSGRIFRTFPRHIISFKESQL